MCNENYLVLRTYSLPWVSIHAVTAVGIHLLSWRMLEIPVFSTERHQAPNKSNNTKLPRSRSGVLPSQRLATHDSVDKHLAHERIHARLGARWT
jgi:hypothetical protein